MTENESLRVMYLIKRVELLVRTKLEAALRDLQVTAGQYAVLSLLSLMPEASSAQLSRFVGVTPQTMAETITAFERQKLISREKSTTHKRILEITLTEKGMSLLKECEVRANEAEAKLFSQFGTEDVNKLRGFLQLVLSSDEQSQS